MKRLIVCSDFPAVGTPEFFVSRFQDFVSEFWNRARDEHDAIERALKHSVNKNAVNSAVENGLIASWPEDSTVQNLAFDYFTQVQSETPSDELPFDLKYYLYLTLTKARNEALIEQWGEFYWHLRGEVSTLDFDTPETVETFRQCFDVMLLDSTDTQHRWIDSGLKIEDLIEDDLFDGDGTGGSLATVGETAG